MPIGKCLSACAALAVMAAAAMPASAAIVNFAANMDGLQEFPSNASPATGFVSLTLDDTTGQVLILSALYQNLTSSSTASHIHGLAGPGVNAGVLIPLTLDSPGSTTGTISGGGFLPVADIPGMLAGQTYVNVHSTNFPGGEIRGQLLVVPEPASLCIVGLAAAALLARRRRV